MKPAISESSILNGSFALGNGIGGRRAQGSDRTQGTQLVKRAHSRHGSPPRCCEHPSQVLETALDRYRSVLIKETHDPWPLNEVTGPYLWPMAKFLDEYRHFVVAGEIANLTSEVTYGRDGAAQPAVLAYWNQGDP